ncbi:MAG: helix-turn-helix domain-containing protein [bacterium]|uniref:Helix-turn-helix domain-containing protein n=1 Tax=Candidatus Methylomirabilis tolerans TaxID=3123416 RepID=A0AAJ1ESR6_9BACT|nr:helix-turn-helix domain-containing protein [Candidatus Methylomirabilis sp.]
MPVQARFGSSQITQTDPSDLRNDAYLTVREVADYTRLSIRTIRKWVHDPHQPLPHYKCGGKLLFRRDQIDQWLRVYFFRRSPAAIDAVDAYVNDILRKLKA